MDKLIIEDLLQTVKRLNEELDSRVEFEQKLIEHINKMEVENNTLRDNNSKLAEKALELSMLKGFK